MAAPCLLLAASQAWADPVVVGQKNRAFGVPEIAIHKGDIVRFSNDDDFDHQVYVQSPGFAFESDEAGPGKQVDVRFPDAGSFEVRCHIHPKMHLRVDVK